MEKFILANWKMHLGIRESVALAKSALLTLVGKDAAPQMVLFPSFTALAEVHKVVVRSRVALGAQDVGFERFGSYTGAVGIGHLEDVGCRYVLLGHSERMRYFGEDRALVRKKLEAVVQTKTLRSVVCVGEGGEGEVRELFGGLTLSSSFTPLIAYEPPDAIGTGVRPSVSEVLTVIVNMREVLGELFPRHPHFPILYGGSVDEHCAYDFLREPEIDGVLVGGASMHVHAFEGIVAAACRVLENQR